jgi:hypothetical protein
MDARSGGTARTNPMGFHGDLRDDPATAARLFSGGNPTGINFDKVCLDSHSILSFFRLFLQ